MGLCQQARQSQIDRELRLRYCPRLGKDSPRSMPLHFGKIFAAIALLTVGAFIAWLLFTTLFATEQAEQKIDRSGALELNAPVAA